MQEICKDNKDNTLKKETKFFLSFFSQKQTEMADVLENCSRTG